MVKFWIYSSASLAVCAGLLGYTYATRQQFFPSVIYLVTSKISILILGNTALVLTMLFGRLVKSLFLGSLRDAEVEILHENVRYAITETCLALTIFREEINFRVVSLFTALVFLKIFHWLSQSRIEFIEQSEFVSRLTHIRLVSLMGVLAAVDLVFVVLCCMKVLETGPSVLVLFGFEFLILFITVVGIFLRYLLHMIDMRMDGNWTNKFTYLFYLELLSEVIKLLVYMVFFMLIFTYYGMPLHIVRDLWVSMKNLQRRILAYFRYRRIAANLNERFPNPTEEELNETDRICIICREEMTSALCKKLPCTHIFHIDCLRMWVQRQQTCPTCRSAIPTGPQEEENARAREPAQQQPNANANAPEAAAGVGQAGQPQVPPGPFVFGAMHPGGLGHAGAQGQQPQPHNFGHPQHHVPPNPQPQPQPHPHPHPHQAAQHQHQPQPQQPFAAPASGAPSSTSTQRTPLQPSASSASSVPASSSNTSSSTSTSSPPASTTTPPGSAPPSAPGSIPFQHPMSGTGFNPFMNPLLFGGTMPMPGMGLAGMPGMPFGMGTPFGTTPPQSAGATSASPPWLDPVYIQRQIDMLTTQLAIMQLTAHQLGIPQPHLMMPPFQHPGVPAQSNAGVSQHPPAPHTAPAALTTPAPTGPSSASARATSSMTRMPDGRVVTERVEEKFPDVASMQREEENEEAKAEEQPGASAAPAAPASFAPSSAASSTPFPSSPIKLATQQPSSQQNAEPEELPIPAHLSDAERRREELRRRYNRIYDKTSPKNKPAAAEEEASGDQQESK